MFITWLRENTDCPEILKSAAHSMKHKPETQASGVYDANADTKLVKVCSTPLYCVHAHPHPRCTSHPPCTSAEQAAYDFNLTFAAKYSAGDVTTSSGSSSGSGIAGAEEHRWLAISQSLTAKLAPATEQSETAGVRAFDLELPIHERMQPGGTVRFPICPGSATNELTVSLPEFGATAKSLRFRVELSKDGAKGSSVRINGYEIRIDTAKAE